MNTLPYPRNVQQIREARANGMKPAGPVMVIFNQAFRATADDAAVYVDVGCAYRWDWVKELNVVVLMDSATKLGTTLDDINECEPAQVDVLDVERRLGWLVCMTRPKLTYVRWPSDWVNDWLGDGAWHKELHRVKKDGAEARTRECAEHERQFAWK